MTKIIFEKTTTRKSGDTTVENNLITNRITILTKEAAPTILPYSIQEIDDNTSLIKKGILLTIITNNEIPEPVIKILSQPEKQKEKKNKGK